MTQFPSTRTIGSAVRVFLCAAICLISQFTSVGMEKTCTCQKAPAKEVAKVETKAATCCSQKASQPTTCCCKTQATECECFDCSCDETDQRRPSVPPIQTQPVELVFVSLIEVSSTFDLPWPDSMDLELVKNSSSFFHGVSSQQMCAVLSRFTC